ncbi:MAG TPA: hypothetical protein VM238_14390 [Phycisphaerae bacterium]|nr:hypothetical protein [Phycisphaerae bacterium]
MTIRTCLVGFVVGYLLAASAQAAPPEPPPALALLPEEAVGFIHVPSIRSLEKGLKHFADQTGWRFGRTDHPVLDLLARRTGIPQGIDLDRNVCIGFVDPKRFRERYTIYIVPVSDWDALLASTKGEVMAPRLYALTGTAGPRFVARRGDFAVVTSSIRTMDALAGAGSLAASLPPETLGRVRSASPVLYVNIHRIKQIYETEITSWFRASSGEVYRQPQAALYGDVLSAYLFGIASFVDQIETVEATVQFGPEGLDADLAVRFVEGAGVAEFLAAQKTRGAQPPVVTHRPMASAMSLRLDPQNRTDFALRATRFFLELAPRPEPLPEPTKAAVYEAVQTFVESLGENVTFLSAPARTGMGIESGVSVYELKDPEQFRRGVELLATAWERLADQLDLYLKFKAVADTTKIGGADVMTYVPRLRFGLPARHVEFRKRLRMLYGPEGMVYRVAIVGNHGVVAAGSDLTLFRRTIERLQMGGEPEVSPAMRRLSPHVSQDQNVMLALSLPVYFGLSLARAGTAADRIGTIDPGHELAGIGLRFEGTRIRLSTYWPHEQIRLARELLDRAAPQITEIPESLFQPEPEAPPKPEPRAPEPLFGPGAVEPPAVAPSSLTPR